MFLKMWGMQNILFGFDFFDEFFFFLFDESLQVRSRLIRMAIAQ